mgnify:CR=1 FL=1
MEGANLAISDTEGALIGQNALVTGASRGIGRAVAEGLATAGAAVWIHYRRNRVAAESVAATIVQAGGRAHLVQANLASYSDVEVMVRDLPAVSFDVLVNNAGIWQSTPLGATSVSALHELLQVNLGGVFWITQSLLPRLRDGARIVSLSSVAARSGVAGGRSVYAATKAGVEALTRNWALELAPRRIRVNAVAPGYVLTDMTAQHFADPAVRQRALGRHPLGRMGTADDIAKVVLFLCSPQSQWITGQTVNASGGFVV